VADKKFLRQVLIKKADTKLGRLDAYLISTGIEEEGEALDIETRVIHGPVRKVLEFVRSLPEGSVLLLSKARYEVVPGQEWPELHNELLEGKGVELSVNATKEELRALLMAVPSVSDGYDPTR
jgi:hypothetical protein